MAIRAPMLALVLLLCIFPPWSEVQASDEPGARPAVIAIIEPPAQASHEEFEINQGLRHDFMQAASVPEGPLLNHTHIDGTHVETSRFYRLDGSRIAGVIRVEETGEEEAVLGVTEHSTRVVGRAVGITTGSCGTCLVVHVTGSMSRGLAWVYHQDWIDAVSISGAGPYDDLRGITEAVRAITDSGRPVFVANGNTYVDHLMQRASALWNSDAIAVAATTSDGVYQTVLYPPGADLATAGDNVPVPSVNGEIVTSGGTSLAAPWIAGHYGRILSEAWRDGWLERVADGKNVRQKIVGPAPAAAYAADGHLDGLDVLSWLGGQATYAHGFTFAAGLGKSAEPSLWIGYGALVDPEYAELSSGPTSMLDPAPMGPGHQLNRAQRQTSATAAIEANKAWCSAVKILIPNIYCADHWLQHDDWFE